MSVNNDLVSNRPISDKIGSCVWPYYSDIDKQIDGVVEMGMKYISAGANIVTTKGWYNQEQLIHAYEYAIEKGLGFMTGSCNDIPASGSNYSDSDLVLIKAGFDSLYSYFSGKGVILTGWNEPNGMFWRGDGGGYAMTDYDTVKASTDFEIWQAKEAKKLAPDCLVTGPTFIYPPDSGPSNRTYINMVASFGLFKYLDGVCEHPYLLQTNDYGCPEMLIKSDNMKVTNLPRVSNEFGFSRNVTSPTNWQGVWSYRDAEKLTLRQILMMDYLEYTIIGLYTAECGTNDFALLNSDGSLSNVGKAIKWLTSELNGYTLDSKIEITEHVGYIDDLYLMKYTKDGAKDKLVYWTPSRIGELYGLVYEGDFYKLKFSDYPQILEVN